MTASVNMQFCCCGQKFTGHSSEVMKLLPVIYPCQDRCDVDDDGATSCHYMISAAANDRVLSLW